MPTLLEVNRQLHLASIMRTVDAYASSVAEVCTMEVSVSADPRALVDAIDKTSSLRRLLEARITTILEAYEAAGNHHQ